MLRKEVIENMKYIVDECMGASDAGCVTNCPMHTDAREYVRLIREEKGVDAIKSIRNTLFIPGTLGRICAHPCEAGCKWSEIKSPISIAALKRYAADNYDSEDLWDLSTAPNKNRKVAIIGSGPAGLQAAIDVRKEGFEVTVFEKTHVRGGWMAFGIPEYRLPRDILERELTYLDKLGIKFELNCEIGKEISFDSLLDEFDSVVVAVGKQDGRIDRSITNHTASGIYSAAEYLKEAAFNRDVHGVGKKVLVVGGGDVAMDCCRVSTRLPNVEEVYSVCLEDSLNSMTSTHEEVHGALEEGVKFNHALAIKSILVDNDNRVNKVELKKCISMFNEQGRFDPKFDNEVAEEIDVDTIVFAIGQGVCNDFAKGYLEQRANSTFECNRLTMQSPTNPKVFIAGDASGESVIVIQAMAIGRRAAQSVIRYLKGESLEEGRKIEDTWRYDTDLNRTVDWNEKRERRLHVREIRISERKKNFNEVSLGFTHDEAMKEANRCLQCECKLCMKECIMLNDFTDCPKNLFKKYLENDFRDLDNLVAYSCNQCEQCTIRCPKDLDLKTNFIEIKEKLAEENDGLVPLEILQPSDKIQELECSEKYCTSVPGKKNTKYVFVPGCTVPAYSPDLIEATMQHLRDTLGEDNVGALLQCCGKVSSMIGEKERFEERNKMALDMLDDLGAEVLVTICPSCYRVFKDTAKQEVITYWDLIRNTIGLPKGKKNIGKDSDVLFNIQDSCVTRHNVDIHEDVRWILTELGYNYEEMNHHGEDTRCCGVGGLVCNAREDLYRELYMRRASDCSQHNVISYCGSCRGTMEAAGKDSLHILNLIHGDKYTKNQNKIRGYESMDGMWANRLESKDRLNKFK